VSGESIRVDVTEDQKGVPMTIDVQVLDTKTCEPVSDVYLEMWHCNSTGVYGGVLAGGNGIGASDKANLQNTWLRGLQRTDDDGAVQFHTLFPGHYIGRTTHIHVMVHLDAKAHENATVINTKATHVGQMFFDQDLITRAEKLAPYTSNKQTLTTNARDGILLQEAATSDPIMAYVELGESLDDGLLAWLAFGVDTSYSRTINAASTVYKDGAVQNAGGGMGGGFPGMPGAGGRPGMPGNPRPTPGAP
jgi:protocatechuate 3,4-dioxygenase beta subunit